MYCIINIVSDTKYLAFLNSDIYEGDNVFRLGGDTIIRQIIEQIKSDNPEYNIEFDAERNRTKYDLTITLKTSKKT